MAQATFHFPRGFLWGSATAAHQVEGKNTNNNWWAWEQQAGHILQGHKSGLACDWWGGRWREDLDRAADGGQNAHRLSIEWSRVQPAPNRWDEDALDRYRQILRGLRERDMTPMVTLHHFSDPLWLEEQGGWENPDVVKYFEAFARKVVDALQEYASLWVTLNEPNVLASSAYFGGIWPPGRSGVRPFVTVSANQARAHAAAYHAIHSLQPTARVGIAHHYRPLEPARRASPLDRGIASLLSGLFNELIPGAIHTGVLRFPFWRQRIPEAKNTQDFLGLNYYSRDLISFNPFHVQELLSSHTYPEGADLSPNRFMENYPQGMFAAIRWGLKFKLPIIITENGVEDAEDGMRPRYLIQHLHQVWRAVNFNYPVKGYFHWSLVDNFEWERGWTQRFGLWELDVETQRRRKRPSASLYAEICQENGISSEMVARYAPEIFEKLFPQLSLMNDEKQIDWQRPETLRTLVCRPALPADTADVMELTRTIWQGEDYVPAVWAEWLEDTQGWLAVAQYGVHAVGLCKLSRLGAGEWWLQGLRVHPEHEGQGFASRLHDYLMGVWEQAGDGVMRLATASFRAPVQHLCARTGFTKIGEFTPFIASGSPGEIAGFTPVTESEIEQAYALALRGSSLRLTGGLMETGWEWVSVTQERMAQAARGKRLWWWQKGRGVLAAREDEEEKALVTSLVSCDLADLPACLLDFRRLAGSSGFERAGWFAPLGAGLEEALSSAGYSREWDASVYVYEKHHPTRAGVV